MTTANPAAPYPAPAVDAAVLRGLAKANDRPNPVFDADCSAEKYAGMERDFRDSAWEHLDKGDLAQASNKAWGLVAETVKAISAHHGHIIHSHRGVWEVLYELAELPGNAGDAPTQYWITNAFTVARSLHSNFYENKARDNDVIAGLMLCEELSERLYALFGPEGAAPVSR